MDEGIVEGCKDVSDSKNIFTFCDLRTERDGDIFLGCFDFFGGLEVIQKSVSRSNGYESILKGKIR